MNTNVSAELKRTTHNGEPVWGLLVRLPEWLMREMGRAFGKGWTWRIANWGGVYTGTEDGGRCSFLLLLVPPEGDVCATKDESEADHECAL